MGDLEFRPASLDDAALLFGWRNDAATRAASRDRRPLVVEDHVRWLTGVLENTGRQLLIVLHDGVPAGTMRVDDDGPACELSWTVAPEHRGRGLGAEMVRRLVAQLQRPVQARIRRDNAASIRIAEAAGLTLEREEDDGLLLYSRPAPA